MESCAFLKKLKIFRLLDKIIIQQNSLEQLIKPKKVLIFRCSYENV